MIGDAAILVTGATGFVGSHAVPALLGRGHRVRLLARTPSKVPAVMQGVGVDVDTDGRVEVVQGDMTDRASVARALQGCRGVLHAAAQVEFRSGTGGATRDLNVEGVRNVVGAAVDAGCDPILYTSSMSAYVPAVEGSITGESPLGDPPDAYGRSKRDAERLVQEWQRDGAPITTFVLGGVYGPVCPHLDGSYLAVQAALATMMITIDGGTPVIDVRDLADLLASATEPGHGPRRYTAGGNFVTWQQWVDDLSRAVGREVPSAPMTVEDFVAMGVQLDRQRAAGEVIDLPISEAAARLMTLGVPMDDSRTLRELGGRYRSTQETFRDQVAWMVAQGHVDPALAPAVA